MITTKTQEEIALMREGGKKLGQILQELLNMSQPGILLKDINRRADALIEKAGGAASFKTVEGYHWATCLCVNDVVVHGIPSDYVLVDGDLLTVDIGILYKGFHTDTAWTKIIKSQTPIRQLADKSQKYADKERFLKVGEEALWKAIREACPGKRIGHISKAIQETVEGAGYSIVRTLVGHGVGHELHEAPQVPGFLRGKIEDTPSLEEGMTIAIEIIYAQGSGSVVYANDDGWAIATRDHSLSAVFEHSLAITDKEPLVLTRSVNSGSTENKAEGLTKAEN